MPPRSNASVLLYGAWVLHAVLVVIGLWDHGLWLDEAHAWCVVRDSPDLQALAVHLRNEGHPWAWFIALWPFAHAGLPCEAMQVLHGLIAITVSALVLFRSPFPPWVRVLVVFGYFLVFEYAAVSRNYALGVLFLFLAVDEHRRRGWSWRHALWMVLLPQVHFWCICFALAWVVVSLAMDRTWTHRRAVSTGLIVLSSVIALLMALPADHLPNSPKASADMIGLGLDRSVDVLDRAWLPFTTGSVPAPLEMLVPPRYGPTARWICAAFLVVLLLLLPGRRPRLLFAGFVCATIMLPFFAPYQATRYGGPAVVGFIAALWSQPLPQYRRLRAVGLLLFFGVQALAAVVVLEVQHVHGFSRVRTAVRWGRRVHPGLPFATVRSGDGPGLSAYAGGPVYYAARGALGSYFIWYPYPVDPSPEQVPQALSALGTSDLLLYAQDTAAVPFLRGAGRQVRIVATCTGGMIGAEDGVLLLVEAPR